MNAAKPEYHRMAWWKHPTGLMEEPDMVMAHRRFGDKGPLGFYRILDFGAAHLDLSNPAMILTDKRKFLEKTFPDTTQKTAKKILDFFQQYGRLKYRFFGRDQIYLEIPYLKEMSDEYTQKLLGKRAKREAQNVGIHVGT